MAKRICRIEELEKREYLAADPSIMMGVVYCEQQVEEVGDMFYVAWVGGEETTTLDSLVINLDKNLDANGPNNREGEAVFDTEGGAPTGVYSSAPFHVERKTAAIEYECYVEDGGQTLRITFLNNSFHAGDQFVFSIDLDEYQEANTHNPMVEGAEMGGSLISPIKGSWITATFSSDHYETETWEGIFVNNYDDECTRFTELEAAYPAFPDSASLLPIDSNDGNEGIWRAGLYTQIDLTPKPIIISGHVYGDKNVDCNLDPTDELLEEVTVTLVGANGTNLTAITNADGYYEFTNLAPGEYDVYSQANVPASGGQTYIDFCAKGGSWAVANPPLQIHVDCEVGGEKSENNNFAKVLPGSIEGYVFEDRNNASNKETGENWDGDEYPAEIQLYRVLDDGSLFLMETQTVDKDGHYRFELDGSYDGETGTWRKLPGRTYQVWEVFSDPDYTDGYDYVGQPTGNAAQDDKFTEVYIGYGVNGTDYNFGELKLGSIDGNVYEDRNDNGIFEKGNEPGIAGVPIELYRFDPIKGTYEKIDETVTDADGYYHFDNLDIVYDYAVKEKEQPSGYDDGKDTAGDIYDSVPMLLQSSAGTVTNDYISDIPIEWDHHGIGYNFGELVPPPPPEPDTAYIEGNVYEDRNDNGVFDTGELGIEGVTIELYKWDGFNYTPLRSTLTDKDGHYRFDNLDVNEQYAVREIQPTAYDDGKDALGDIVDDATPNPNVRQYSYGTLGSDYLSDIWIGQNENGVRYNFGELKLGSISGYVYHDVYDNGVRDSGDAPIGGVQVELYRLESSGYQLIDTTWTDANGFYKFDGLDIEKTYAVREIQPYNWIDGKDSVGTPCGGRLVPPDTIDSIYVKWDEHGVNYNFGELKPDGGGPWDVPKIQVTVPNNTWGVSPTNFPYIYYQPTIPGSMTTLYGGGGFVDPYAWHLSTLNDAYPKSEEVVGSLAGFRKELGNATMLVDNNFGTVTTVGNSERYVDAEWILRDLDDSATETHYRFGKIGAKPIVGDWNGDGKDYIGIFDSGDWYLDRNGDGVWNVEDILARMGSSEDQPVSGDWDGDGKTDIGVFGPRWDDDPYLLNVEKGLPSDNKDYVTVSYNDAKNSENSPTRDAELRSPRLSSRRVARRGMAQDRLDLIDHVFKYGAQGDVALTGDWTGDGISKIGVYHKGEWYLDRNGNGVLDDDDEILRGDAVGDDFIPVVGDFDGDGIDTVGYFSNGRWLLDVNGDHQLQEFHLGRDGDKPVTGDWDGDGRDEIGVYRETGDSSAPVETQSTFSYDETDFSSPSAY